MPTNYAGNSANFPEEIQVPNGSDAPSSTLFATPYEGLADRTATTNLRQAVALVSNMSPQATWPTSLEHGITAAAFNGCATGTASQTWLICSFTTGGSPTINVYSGSGGGDGVWSLIGGELSTVDVASSICADAQGFMWVASAAPSSAGQNQLAWLGPSGGTWTQFLPVSAAELSDLKVVGAVAGAPSYVGYVAFAAGSATANSGFLGEAPSTGGPVAKVTGINASTWSLKSSGSLIIALPQTAGAPSLYTCTDPATWTAQSLSAIVSSGQTPIDVAWNPSAPYIVGGITYIGLWLMGINQLGGCSFATSPDGINWTAGGSLSNSGEVVSIACFQGVWFVATINNTTHVATLLYTIDGTNFFATDCQINPSGSNFPEALIVAGAKRCLFYEPMPAGGSTYLPYRFSLATVGGSQAT
jgi:hypothetical protein